MPVKRLELEKPDILYIDDFEEIKDGIEKVFEKAYAFTNEISIDDF